MVGTLLTGIMLNGMTLLNLTYTAQNVIKAFLGVVIVVIITNSLIRLGLRSGVSSLILGTILLLAVAIDVRWLKNRAKVLARAYVSPTYFALPPLQEVGRAPNSPYAINDWIIDALEGRGNGRISCYDPRDGSSKTVLSGRQFPNGICMVPDGQSFLFAET